MGRDRARMAVYVMGGFYLLYLAYSLFQNLDEITENKGFFIGFMIFFAVVGAAVMGYGIWFSYKMSRAKSQEEEQTGDQAEEHTGDQSEDQAKDQAEERTEDQPEEQKEAQTEDQIEK